VGYKKAGEGGEGGEGRGKKGRVREGRKRGEGTPCSVVVKTFI